MNWWLPYILIPLALMLIWRLGKLPAKGLSFLITILLLLLYPAVFIRLDAYYHPTPEGESECLMFDTVAILGNFVVMIPFALAFQLILFAVFVRDKPARK